MAYQGQFALEKLIPGISGQSIGSNLPGIDFSGVTTLLLPSGGAVTAPVITGGLTASGSASNDFSGSTGTFKFPSGGIANAVVPTAGVAAAGGFSNPTAFNTGRRGAIATTGLTSTQIVTTDTYFAEVFIPANTTLTGIAILNGHTTNAGVNLSVGLANSAGTIVAKSATTATQTTADAYQQIPFTSTYQAVGPAKYYVAVQGSTTTGYLFMHAIGNFGAALKTSETYGTFLTTASYSTTTFTTNQGIVAETY